ncbi:putative P-type Ca(2+) transporter [Helianthus annuus]|nr:putative P-type Ca(2+) transporter [Helianthus annuus]
MGFSVKYSISLSVGFTLYSIYHMGDLVLLAIDGLNDPCRPGVRDAVQLCVKARVKVRMVMGDNLQTTKAIALECGILRLDADATKPNLIEGKSFRAMSDAQRLEVAERISIVVYKYRK